MKQIKVMSVFGTRPEAIKMAPLVLTLKQTPGIESIVAVTGQHRQMLDQVLQSFHIHPDYDLNLMKANQTLAQITAGVLEGVSQVIETAAPDLVLVHGDTTTSMAAALAAFYHRVPVGHVEAGLRSFDKYSPFPEEMNRVMTGRIAELHFAPTERNRANLAREGVTENVFVVGNTVIDALHAMVKDDYTFESKQLHGLDFSRGRYVLLTAHRRENLGEPLENICRAVKRIAADAPDVTFVYPVHLNPAVRKTAEAILADNPSVKLIDPLDVEDMHNLMKKSFLVMTDSGGLQEEAPALGKPVIVLRTETERPEVVEAGKAILAGVQEEDIYRAGMKLLTDQAAYQHMCAAENPYGDGHTSEKIARAILGWAEKHARA